MNGYKGSIWATIKSIKKKAVSLEVIQELMGHADPETTKIYVEPFDEDILKESQQAAINATK